jgi:hypothetical protein
LKDTPFIPAVLQKILEEQDNHGSLVSLLRLDSDPEQFSDEPRLAGVVSFVHPMHLSLPDHIHALISPPIFLE